MKPYTNLTDWLLVAYATGLNSKDKGSLLPVEILKWFLFKIKLNNIFCEDLSFFTQNFITDSNIIRLISNIAKKDFAYKHKRSNLLRYVSELLEHKQLQHVFIKELKHPLAKMTDIDVLVPRSETTKVLRILRKVGFHVIKYPLSDPDRYVARYFLEGVSIDVELYPDGIWYRRRICDGSDVISRRQYVCIEDSEVPFPAPEDDLYFVAVHGYYDLTFTLAMILHGSQILDMYKDSFNWERLVRLAYNYGTIDAVYLYLLVLNKYYEDYLYPKQSPIPSSVIALFEKSWMCRSIKKWYVKKQQESLSFPVHIPFSLGRIHSSLNYYIVKFRRNQFTPLDTICDVLSQIRHLDFNLRQNLQGTSFSDSHV